MTPRCLVRLFVLSLLLVFAAPATAEEATETLWYRVAADGEVQLKLYFFWSETCPHCARAQAFVEPWAAQHSWLVLDSLEVTRSYENQRLFAFLATHVDQEIRGVPAFFLCGKMLVGFDDAQGVGAGLIAFAERCRAVLKEELTATVSEPETPSPQVRLPLIGSLDVSRLSLPVLTVVLGGMDAFNPCAFFVLLFLLSMLVHARSRARMLLIGGIFVLFSGLLYFLFMAAWLNLFLVLEGIRIVTVVAGLVAVALAAINIKDFFAFKRGVTLSIPDSARPGLFARMHGLLSADNLPALLAGTVTLAVAANTYELLCTSGFPLVYTRALTLSELPTSSYYLYLALYNVIYVMPLLIIVLTFTLTLGARKLTEKQGRVLKLLSGSMMLGLGLVLLVAPDLLDNWLTAVALLVVACGITWIAYLADRLRTHPA